MFIIRWMLDDFNSCLFSKDKQGGCVKSLKKSLGGPHLLVSIYFILIIKYYYYLNYELSH
jgi:hypothetical protein